MKKNQWIKLWPFAALILAALAMTLAFTGCNTPQQTTAYNSLYSLEQTTTAAVDSYDALVIAGKVPTNDVPKVAKAYNDFQAGFRVALDAVQFNTNAAAPFNLVQESQDVISLISTIKTQAQAK